MIDKTRIVYKGDKLLASLYIGVSCFVFILLSFIFTHSHRLGWLYFCITMAILSAYSLIKGIMMYIISKDRIKYYNGFKDHTMKSHSEEKNYNFFRLKKKEVNRRRYLYTAIIAFVIGTILFITTVEKGLILGTALPLILFAIMEFGIGLTTEFRLWEYQRQLEKMM
jgi:predicted histidine transporter YuiF (NhaC family)